MNELAVTIGLISLPGLIATIVADKLIVHAIRWDAFKYAVYTFVFGLGSYGLLQCVVWLLLAIDRHLPFLPPVMSLATWKVLTASGTKPALAEIAWATGFAPALAMLAALAVNRKWINRSAQWAGVSAKYGDENLFSYYLNLDGLEWVYVRDIANDLSYRGQIHSFSETGSLQELVLSDVTVYRYQDSVELYKVPSMYLCRPLGMFLIEAAQEGKTEEAGDEEGDQRRCTPYAGEGRSASDDERAKAVESSAATTPAQTMPQT